MEDLVRIGRCLRLITQVMTRPESPRGEPGLQTQQYWVLGELLERPKQMSEIAEATVTSQASLTGIVDRLERHRLIERTRSNRDRRVIQVSLTKSGRAEWLRRREVMMGRLREIMAPLDQEQRHELLSLLTAMVSELSPAALVGKQEGAA